MHTSHSTERLHLENHIRSMPLPDGTDLVSELLELVGLLSFIEDHLKPMFIVLYRRSNQQACSCVDVKATSKGFRKVCPTAVLPLDSMVEEREVTLVLFEPLLRS